MTMLALIGSVLVVAGFLLAEFVGNRRWGRVLSALGLCFIGFVVALILDPSIFNR